MQAPAGKLPWYFHPGWLWGILMASLPAQAFLLYAPAGTVAKSQVEGVYFVIAGFYLSWSYLLYEYLAPYAPDRSRHWPGRNNMLIAILLTLVVFARLLSLYGANTAKPNEPADLMVFPLFISVLLLNWRACDLFASFERDKFPRNSVTVNFIAMFYLPLSVFWFHRRLKSLHRSGKV